jgi:hypothetical protein
MIWDTAASSPEADWWEKTMPRGHRGVLVPSAGLLSQMTERVFGHHYGVEHSFDSPDPLTRHYSSEATQVADTFDSPGPLTE